MGSLRCRTGKKNTEHKLAMAPQKIQLTHDQDKAYNKT